MKLSTITKATARASIDFDGETLNLTVCPYVMTPERERFLNSAEPDEQVDALLAFFCEYVAAWDLEGDDGEPVKLTPDVVQSVVPSALLLRILRSAAEQTSPLDPTSKRKPKR